jgi:hypothetical protein
MSTSVNPFEEINQKLDTLIKRVESIENIKKVPSKIPLKDFCRDRNVSRVTAYAWDKKGLIRLTKIGGRQYVNSDSVVIEKKYQREPMK